MHCFLVLRAQPQEDEKIKTLIETLTENMPEHEELSEITERLAIFRKRPINLNNTNPEELKNLFFLSPLQINSFFNYIARNRLLDVLELQAIPGFDPETINSILPYVTLTHLADYEGLKVKKLWQKGNHDLILRYGKLLQTQKGFKDLPGSRYLGSPEKVLMRYRYHFQEIISAALVLEKDAGERLFNSKRGLDHLTAHLAFFKLGRIKKLVLGDYSMQFGQGLTLWSGFAFGKGPDVTSVAARDVGLKPYTSANESSFFRGVAATINLHPNISISPFVSFRKLDASLKNAADGSVTLSNINISGLHRTATELKNQQVLGQQVYGTVLQYNSDNLNMGFIGYYTSFEHRFVTGTAAYNSYGFRGKQLANMGGHYNYTFKNVYLYGEVAHSIGSGMAMVNGAMASLSPRLSAVLLHRSYDRHYHNFFSSAIGEGTETNNENGWYAGLNYSFARNFSWAVYGDYFKFPWLRYRVDAPSKGFEILSQLRYTKGKNFKTTLRFKMEHKQQNADSGSHITSLEWVVKQNLRWEWNLTTNRKFNFQQRLEITSYQKGIKKSEQGYMLYQDLAYTPMASAISGNMRLAFFYTPSYNSRIYAYENDVLYGSGSGVYSGKGIRFYINSRYKPTKKMDIWMRYALFVYRNVSTIGSGLDEITGDRKSEVKLQLRYQF